jgi:hypothetical protein
MLPRNLPELSKALFTLLRATAIGRTRNDRDRSMERRAELLLVCHGQQSLINRNPEGYRIAKQVTFAVPKGVDR